MRAVDGVIYMITIAMILGAITAAFAFGMVGDLQKPRVISVTLHRMSASSVVATFHGGQDATSLEKITFTPTDSSGVTQAPIVMGTPASVMPVGHTQTLSIPANSHVVGVATFSDGSSQLVVDANV
jgi:archaeal type IV pilus assembly protein PilA